MKYSVKSAEGIFDWMAERELKKQSKEKAKQQAEKAKVDKQNKQILNTKVKPSKNYDPTLPSKLSKLFESAWNYSAYKLPKDMGVNENGEKADPDYEGFDDKIEVEPGVFKFDETVRNGCYVLTNEDIANWASFAYGQPFSFPLYDKVGRDIIAKWTQALKIAANKIIQKLQGRYPGINIDVELTLGPDICDADCIYINIDINIPLNCF